MNELWWCKLRYNMYIANCSFTFFPQIAFDTPWVHHEQVRNSLFDNFIFQKVFWLVVSTPLKNMLVKMETYPRVGMNIKKIFELPPPSIHCWSFNWNFWKKTPQIHGRFRSTSHPRFGLMHGAQEDEIDRRSPQPPGQPLLQPPGLGQRGGTWRVHVLHHRNQQNTYHTKCRKNLPKNSDHVWDLDIYHIKTYASNHLLWWFAQRESCTVRSFYCKGVSRFTT